MNDYRPDYFLLHEGLADIDLIAVSNVLSGKGGPFSAAIFVLVKDEGGVYKVHHQLPVAANAVLSLGRASAHAEDQALRPHILRETEAVLEKIKTDFRAPATRLLFLSSAQPCMACFSKIAICARSFVSRGLLQPRHFDLVYGATYADTESIAGFKDYGYALDFVKAAQNRFDPSLLVRLETAMVEGVPENVLAPLFAGKAPRAVLVQSGAIISVGEDRRGAAGLFATAECTALHNASADLLKRRAPKPWDLGGATLYVRTQDLDPLTYAEGQWANIGKIVTVLPPDNGIAYAQTQVAPDCHNGALFATIADGYNNPKSSVAVYCDGTFENRAQNTWASKLDRKMYNGSEAESAFTQKNCAAFDALFRPCFLYAPAATGVSPALAKRAS